MLHGGCTNNDFLQIWSRGLRRNSLRSMPLLSRTLIRASASRTLASLASIATATATATGKKEAGDRAEKNIGWVLEAECRRERRRQKEAG